MASRSPSRLFAHAFSFGAAAFVASSLLGVLDACSHAPSAPKSAPSNAASAAPLGSAPQAVDASAGPAAVANAKVDADASVKDERAVLALIHAPEAMNQGLGWLLGVSSVLEARRVTRLKLDREVDWVGVVFTGRESMVVFRHLLHPSVMEHILTAEGVAAEDGVTPWKGYVLRDGRAAMLWQIDPHTVAYGPPGILRPALVEGLKTAATESHAPLRVILRSSDGDTPSARHEIRVAMTGDNEQLATSVDATDAGDGSAVDLLRKAIAETGTDVTTKPIAPLLAKLAPESDAHRAHATLAPAELLDAVTAMLHPRPQPVKK